MFFADWVCENASYVGSCRLSNTDMEKAISEYEQRLTRLERGSFIPSALRIHVFWISALHHWLDGHESEQTPGNNEGRFQSAAVHGAQRAGHDLAAEQQTIPGAGRNVNCAWGLYSLPGRKQCLLIYLTKGWSYSSFEKSLSMRSENNISGKEAEM